ncbi:hypothetical protein Zmor_013611 [Zophobas morio]|uniref:Uncharacterized protein n=1 Tax=Zophobas morio TaxID=2755281 RepID=A0AA38IDB5_9CUCU|nr:hypothetical protein Zmor_013611 [Zophobas morio]
MLGRSENGDVWRKFGSRLAQFFGIPLLKFHQAGSNEARIELETAIFLTPCFSTLSFSGTAGKDVDIVSTLYGKVPLLSNSKFDQPGDDVISVLQTHRLFGQNYGEWYAGGLLWVVRSPILPTI